MPTLQLPSRPAEMLTGEVLSGGWKVGDIVQRSPSSTGGRYSVGYHVENTDGTKGYLKALDLSEILQARNAMEELEAISRAYNFEVAVCQSCRTLKNVVAIINHGQANLSHKAPGIAQVFYLIFERAEGDLRKIITQEERHNDILWKIRVLRNVASGLNQLHRSGVTHQDLKPSNVLGFKDELFKIADFGSSSAAGKIGPRDELAVSGDRGYAPIELLYPSRNIVCLDDRKSTDLFLLGSLFFFHFSGVSALSALIAEQQRQPQRLTERFHVDLPLWQLAFANCLESFENSLADLPKEISAGIISIVAELCEPDPQKRGNPARRLATQSERLLMQRYESRLVHLERTALALLK